MSEKKKTVTAYFNLSMEQATEICADLLHDLAGRGVIGDVLAEIPDIAQQDMRETWAKIMRKQVNQLVRARRVNVRPGTRTKLAMLQEDHATRE